jgi:phage tail protein X
MSTTAIQHTTTEGERWDLLAWRYYADPMAYEQILAANPQMPFCAVLPGGLTLYVPVTTASDTVSAQDLPPWKQS